MTKKLYASLLMIAVLAGCGGGGSDSKTSTNDPSTETNPTTLGTISTPHELSLVSPNAISSESATNHYSFATQSNSKLFLHVELSTPLAAVDFRRCYENLIDTLGTKMYIYDSNKTRIDDSCGVDFAYTNPDSTPKLVKFDYPYKAPGFVFAQTILENEELRHASTNNGTPRSPKSINVTSANVLSGNTFYNYYGTTLNAGQTLIVDVALNTPLDQAQKTRCLDATNTQKTHITSYNNKLEQQQITCGESLRFTAPTSGDYIFWFNYVTQSSGKFYAALTN